MKKIILTITFIASGLMASAQVGVGTTNPETSLEVVGANADIVTKAPGALAAADGVTVPVVTTDMTIALPGIAAGTRVGQLVYSNFTGKTGFYFWNGTAWAAVGGAAPAPQRYEAIRGTVTPVNATAYTVQPNDYLIETRHNAQTTITFPALTNTAADIGRTVQVFNNNSETAGTLYVGVTGGNTTTNQRRGRIFTWTGLQWVVIGL